ncbi:RNA-guided endonuclease InsQ/TnpB family protein [Photobacterium leiognathi]|uniref:RNA-guided endonuclease InsQ/TnpB family protein n=1 Tax=Photobacterium leiognathi TaxID=553611 RepID=UPI0029820FBC|nr:RNA-guided endonuclease TnpB family protein [Photobacterium leiognathi]
MQKTISSFKTFRFKIHNLSNKKKRYLDQSMKQGTMVFYKLINAAKEPVQQAVTIIDELRSKQSAINEDATLADSDKTKQVREINSEIKQLKRELLSNTSLLFHGITKPLPFGSAIKDGAVEDALAQVSSYIELLEIGQSASLPQQTDCEVDFHLAYQELMLSTTKEQEDHARNNLARLKQSNTRPITLTRYRETMLLVDDNNRLLAFPLLWSAKDKRSEIVEIDATDTRTGERFKKKSKQGMILFLECSPWHIEAITNGTAKTSKIYKRGDDYYLSVAVEFKAPARETTTIMGIDRGISEIATYCVRDKETGQVLAKGTFTGQALKIHQQRCEEKQRNNQRLGKKLISSWSNYADNLLHNISKQIVDLADQYDSQVVLENLQAISNGHHHKRVKFARKTNFSRMLSRQQYGKLEGMLNYKLAYVGLPNPRKVHAAGTSMTCPKCGHSAPENRLKYTEELRSIFNCVNCKFKEHSDINGAINIAGKMIWFDANKTKFKKGKKLPSELLFSNWQAANLELGNIRPFVNH